MDSNQVQQIKSQLIQHIGNSFPEDKKEFAIKQIQDMNSESLEKFLESNNLEFSGNSLKSKGQQNIFDSIVSGEIPSYKVGENEDAIAVLEINPLSEGHSIIIPKKHVPSKEEISDKAKELSEEISDRLKNKLKPKKVEIFSSKLFGYEIINVVPVYGEVISTERSSSQKDELEKIKNKILEESKAEEKEQIIKEPKKEEITSENTWLPKRIP